MTGNQWTVIKLTKKNIGKRMRENERILMDLLEKLRTSS